MEIKFDIKENKENNYSTELGFLAESINRAMIDLFNQLGIKKKCKRYSFSEYYRSEPLLKELIFLIDLSKNLNKIIEQSIYKNKKYIQYIQ